MNLSNHHPGQEMSQKLQTHALKLIAAQNNLKEIKLAGWVCDRVPSNGLIIYRVGAFELNKPKRQIFSIVIDEKGEIIDLKALSKKEKVKFFPSFPRPDTMDFFHPAEIIHFPNPFLRHYPYVTINPSENKFTLAPGEIITEEIHVTIPEVPNPLFDVYFLTDATGSMVNIIDAVKDEAALIMTDIQTACPGISFAFGVGSYWDFVSDPVCFNHLQSITTNTIQVQASINGWTIGIGGDGAEGQLFALHQLATLPTIGWRTGSKKIVVWIGDNPGHDPICASLTGLPTDIHELDVIEALNSIGIRVLAISTNTGWGLDADATTISGDYPCPPTGNPGQGTRIALQTGGQYFTGVPADDICQLITSWVIAATTNIYNNVNLVATGSSAALITSITPEGGYGPTDGSNHDFEFHVTFTGPPCIETDQVFRGTIDVVADGNLIAQKKVIITVLACAKWSYGVKFLCGYVNELPPGVVPLTPASTLRPGIYATDVNILNYHNYPVTVHKYIYPLIRNTKPVGREPNYVLREGEDVITLPNQSATFDDCYRLHEIVGDLPVTDEPLSVGFLEIVSPVELNVTAVYTTNDLRGISVGLEVIQVEGKLIGKK